MNLPELTERADDINATIEEAGAINTNHERDYFAMAKKLSIGENIAPEEIAAVLHGAGKTGDELKQLVVTLQHRADLRQQISDIPKMKQRVEEIRHEIETANQALESSVQIHAQKCGPLQHEAYSLELRISQSSALPSQLQGSCPDARLRARFNRLEFEIIRLRDECRAPEKDLLQLLDDLRDADDDEKCKAAPLKTKLEKKLRDARAEWGDACSEREAIVELMRNF